MATNRLAEAVAFTEAAHQMDPDALVMACGWTAHDLLTHVVAGGAEMARLLQYHLSGTPVPATMPFQEREPAIRALPFGQLLELLDDASLSDGIAAMAGADPNATLPFTGWQMTANELLTHIRSELALHRWDMVGTDDVSIALLGQPELTEHAVKSLSKFEDIGERLEDRSRRSGVSHLDTRLRAVGQPDIRIVIDGSGQSIELVEPSSAPAIVATAGDRLLMLWGRCPAAPWAARSEVEQSVLAATMAWLFS